MNYLIDTNVLLMFALDDHKIDIEHKNIIISEENPIYISIVSLWEICIKLSIGKLKLNIPLDKFFSIIENPLNIKILPIKIQHLIILEKLPFHHRDPFDRIIFAQASAEKMNFLYTDKIFDKYRDL